MKYLVIKSYTTIGYYKDNFFLKKKLVNFFYQPDNPEQNNMVLSRFVWFGFDEKKFKKLNYISLIKFYQFGFIFSLDSNQTNLFTYLRINKICGRL